MSLTQPERGDFKVLRTISTRWEDEDVYGHINNVVYYSFFDTAVNGFLMDATGVDIRQLPEYGIVAETSCRFLRELRFPGDVQAGIALEKLGESSVIYQIGLFQGADVAPAAVGRFVHVYVRSSDRTVTRVPDVIRSALTGL